MDRARGIYELAIKQPLLDMPEILWKVIITWNIYADLIFNQFVSFFRLTSILKSNKKKAIRPEPCMSDF
jgi:hypothetical protein